MYDQIRFLNDNGQEMVRVNYKNSIAEQVDPQMLDRFEKAKLTHSTTDYSVLNKSGYWIKSAIPGKEWGFVLDHGQAFSKTYPDVWKRLRGQHAAGGIKYGNGIFVFDSIYPEIAIGLKTAKADFRIDRKFNDSVEDRWYLTAFLSGE